MKPYYSKTLLLVVLMFAASYTYAHVPVIVEQDTVLDLVSITKPEVSKTFYGALTNFPHTYQIQADASFRLKAEILIPDIPEAKHNISGIIIREIEGSGRVEEIARLSAGEASWESFYEPFGGDTYLRGPSFDAEVGGGVYRIEVSTPDNVEKYVLSVGFLEENDLGYITLLQRIAAVKTFFNKSQFMVVQSPFVYVPLVLITLAGLFAYRRWGRMTV
jgi:hypothetical protein